MPSDEEDLGQDGGLFNEPEDFYQPDKPPTFVQYSLNDGRKLNLRLVGHNPLWGHLLWNAGKTTAQYLEKHAQELVENKTILELGAGAGLPSLVCALKGGRIVLVTDYPDHELVENLRYNIDHCGVLMPKSTISAQGFLWGSAPEILTSHLDGEADGFDLLILADILFNHSEHEKLVATLKSTMRKSNEARALVFFTPYRPWLLEKDLKFFDLVKEAGFTVDQVLEKVMDKVMFDNDPGDELLRRTVFGYEVRWDLKQHGKQHNELDLSPV